MLSYIDLHQIIPTHTQRAINYPKMQHYFTVEKEQVQEFQRRGFIKIKQILKKEQLEEFRQVMNEAVDRVANTADKQERIDDYSSIFTQVTNLWRVETAAQPFVTNPLFADIARQLLGVDHVRLYHDQALVKQPKAGKTPWHQDYFYWPIDSPRTVTMWMPMHECPKSMGTMRFAVGSHLAEGLEMMPISEQSEAHFERVISEFGWQVDSYDLDVGDATFHYGRTLHCSHSNGQTAKREAMTIIFFEEGARAVPENHMNSFRKVDLSVFCPGVECGQTISSELNPFLI